MQDDSPWKPPTDPDGDVASGTESDAPSSSTPPSVWAPSSEHVDVDEAADAPSLPSIPAPPPSTTPSIPAPPPSTAPSIPAPPPTTSVAAASSTTVAPQGFPQGDTVVVQSADPSPGRSKRSKWLVGGAMASVLAVGAAGVFAIGNLTGSAAGGAASPDELGMAMMSAVENEDVLGLIDVLSPGERDVFRDPLVDLVDELIRLEILSPDADLAQILGLDVELSNESVRVESTNVPDITNIAMSADAVVSIDGADVPIGELITDNIPDDMLTEMRGTRVTETDTFDLTMTAVAHDGRWYFSVFHTIAELARDQIPRGELDPVPEIPAQGIGADGGDTPEAAVDGLLDAVEALDLTGLMRRLNPGEAAALQRYAPLFIEDAQSVLDEVPLEWDIVTREFRVVGDGDTRTVMIDALAIEGEIDGTAFSVSFADGCIVAEGDGDRFEACESDSPTADIDELLGDAPETQALIETITEAFSDIEEVGLELRRFDGQWYVSPVNTVSEGFLAVLRALDRSEIDAIVEQAPAAFEEFSDTIFGGINSLPGTFGDDVAIDEGSSVLDSADDLFDDDSDPFEFDESTDFEISVDDALDIDPLDEAWSDCYGISDAAEAAACFTDVAGAGGPSLSLMPLALRFPECGYEVSWEPGFYQLPDAEFIGAAEAARPCFLDLVEQGAIQAWELPSEISHLECFEGRNWYQVFDDPEYDERYFECISGE